MKNLLAWLDVHFEARFAASCSSACNHAHGAGGHRRISRSGTELTFRKNCAVSPSSISSISRRAS